MSGHTRAFPFLPKFPIVYWNSQLKNTAQDWFLGEGSNAYLFDLDVTLYRFTVGYNVAVTDAGATLRFTVWNDGTTASQDEVFELDETDMPSDLGTSGRKVTVTTTVVNSGKEEYAADTDGFSMEANMTGSATVTDVFAVIQGYRRAD